MGVMQQGVIAVTAEKDLASLFSQGSDVFSFSLSSAEMSLLSAIAPFDPDNEEKPQLVKFVLIVGGICVGLMVWVVTYFYKKRSWTQNTSKSGSITTSLQPMS